MRKDECKERSIEFASCEYLMHPSGIEISEDDFQDFKVLLKDKAQLAMAMKQFAKRGKARAVQVEED